MEDGAIVPEIESGFWQPRVEHVSFEPVHARCQGVLGPATVRLTRGRVP
jgi:hypothetical protein